MKVDSRQRGDYGFALSKVKHAVSLVLLLNP